MNRARREEKKRDRNKQKRQRGIKQGQAKVKTKLGRQRTKKHERAPKIANGFDCSRPRGSLPHAGYARLGWVPLNGHRFMSRPWRPAIRSGQNKGSGKSGREEKRKAEIFCSLPRNVQPFLPLRCFLFILGNGSGIGKDGVHESGDGFCLRYVRDSRTDCSYRGLWISASIYWRSRRSDPAVRT